MERSRTPWIVPYVIGYGVGTIMQIVICNTSDEGDITTEQVEQVQNYGYQIANELSTQFESIEDLRLTVGGQEFEFNSEDRSCSGEYEVMDEVATIAGDITCSLTIETNN